HPTEGAEYTVSVIMDHSTLERVRATEGARAGEDAPVSAEALEPTTFVQTIAGEGRTISGEVAPPSAEGKETKYVAFEKPAEPARETAMLVVGNDVVRENRYNH